MLGCLGLGKIGVFLAEIVIQLASTLLDCAKPAGTVHLAHVGGVVKPAGAVAHYYASAALNKAASQRAQ